MLHYVHGLVANCLCLLLGAGQLANSSFVKVFANNSGESGESESNQKSVGPENKNNELKDVVKPPRAEGNCRTTW